MKFVIKFFFWIIIIFPTLILSQEVLISDEEDGISPATNNDSEETNSLKLESMGIAGPFVPWTQRAMFIQFRSLCPAVDITIESKAPHGADFNSAEFLIDAL